VGTIQGVAKKVDVHRRMVPQHQSGRFAGAEAAVQRKPKLGPIMEFIDGILRADAQTPHEHRLLTGFVKNRPKQPSRNPAYVSMCGDAGKNCGRRCERFLYPEFTTGA
jgi:hypothetical protein